ncbi:MAG: hypothetical protein P8X70_03570, partial [Nanoarchaeota archaeon]
EFLENGEIEEESENEEQDVDVLEFSLSDEDIDELIEKLEGLKESKSHFHFSIDDENELLVHHEEDELLQ